MDKPFVRYEVKDGVARITFFHPGHNALPSDLLNQLAHSLYTANADVGVKIVLLQSYGNRTFCAGANFDELLAIEDFETGKAFFSGFGNVINAIRKVDKLVVGRVQGKAVGGGVGLAAACDITFATQYAAVRLSEISIGIGPFVIAPAVERKIGKTALAEMTWQPMEWLDAGKAGNLGLYARVFDDIDSMDEYIDRYLAEMAAYNPEAIRSMKRALWENETDWDVLLEKRAELSGQLVLSDFAKNALNKFKQK